MCEKYQFKEDFGEIGLFSSRDLTELVNIHIFLGKNKNPKVGTSVLWAK